MKTIIGWIIVISLEVLTLIVIIVLLDVFLKGIYENSVKADSICDSMDISCRTSTASSP